MTATTAIGTRDLDAVVRFVIDSSIYGTTATIDWGCVEDSTTNGLGYIVRLERDPRHIIDRTEPVRWAESRSVSPAVAVCRAWLLLVGASGNEEASR